MAVADTNYRLVYTDIGGSGKGCDSTIFKQSTLWTWFLFDRASSIR